MACIYGLQWLVKRLYGLLSGSGVTAAILYVIFKDLGVKRISLYDGSWCEWGSLK